MTTHKHRIRRRAQIAQVVAVIAAAAGAGAAFVPVPGPGDDAPSGPAPVVQPPASDASRVALGDSDFQLVSLVMSTSVEQRERPGVKLPTLPPPPEETGDEPEPPPSDTGVTSGAWQYVGTIISPNSTVAIVNDEEQKQHFFFEGDKHNATTVVSIAADHIMVRDGDGPARRVDLQSRSASLYPEAPAVSYAGAPSNQLPLEYQKPPVGFDTWPPERQQEWLERQQQVMRQINEQRARNANQSRTPPVRPAVPVKGPVKEFK